VSQLARRVWRVSPRSQHLRKQEKRLAIGFCSELIASSNLCQRIRQKLTQDRNTPFDNFMHRVLLRPLPTNAISRIRLLAKEMAEGAAEGIWEIELYYESEQRGDFGATTFITDTYRPTEFEEYLQKRWSKKHPDWKLLAVNGYVKWLNGGVRLLEKAFQLLDEVQPAEIFISYRRNESSAFALLVLARLKSFDLNAFLDMSIQAGDDWHAQLEDEVDKRDYFILLLGGKETLISPYVRREIEWAMQSNSIIIPIWHNEFEYKSSAFDVSPEIDRMLSMTHTIRVLEESASAYNTAIVELLNRFGITP